MPIEPARSGTATRSRGSRFARVIPAESPGFSTRAIHVGQAPDPVTGAVVPPISLATTFAQPSIGEHYGYEYSRSGNPTRSAYEECLASLEGAAAGCAFASGLAAEDAVLRLLRPGDHVVLGADAYGGTFRLISKVHAPSGITWSAADLREPGQLAADWPANTRMVWVESPSNPRLSTFDVAHLADVAHARGAIVVVDNTIATPFYQRPLELGADVVVHSATKYLGGHSDVVGGFVATNDTDGAEQITFLQNAVGAVPSPFDCYLVLRGLKTLALRMERHTQNATAIAEMLRAHPAIATVHYPGFSGMVSFVPVGGDAAAQRVVERTELFTLGESLGAVESLIELPARMTHASALGSALEVPADLVRLSVGIEDIADLHADLTGALAGL
jgi:cystathionine gamma-synthase